MIKKTIYVFIIALFAACTGKQKQQTAETVLSDTVEIASPFPELEAGESFYKKQNPFGKIIELTGTNVANDTAIFKPGECEMLVKDNFLIMKNIAQPFRIFSLPDLIQQKTVGKWGGGPDEFYYSTLVSTPDNELLCYLFETTNQKSYKLYFNGVMEYNRYPFQTNEGRKKYGSEMKVTNIAEGDFLYVADSSTGKSIYRITQQGDSAVTKEVLSLGLNPNRKSPFSYIGDFAVNPAKNRMAYAYKYFKIIKFMDLEANTIHVVNFEKEEFDDNTLYKINGLDQNITHYWGACGQDDYVYFLYSGRTPSDVVKEWSKQNYYIYVEQYDWNGNPVNSFRLDQWGYFTVDEKNKKIYLASTNYDDPFFVYQLP